MPRPRLGAARPGAVGKVSCRIRVPRGRPRSLTGDRWSHAFASLSSSASSTGSSRRASDREPGPAAGCDIQSTSDRANLGPRRRLRTRRRRSVSIDRSGDSGDDRGDRRSRDGSFCDWSLSFRLPRPRRLLRPLRPATNNSPGNRAADPSTPCSRPWICARAQGLDHRDEGDAEEGHEDMSFDAGV